MTRGIWRSLISKRMGNALVSALIASGVIAGIGIIMVNRATASVRQMQMSAEADQAWYLAMAGIEDVMARLRWDTTSWTNLTVNNTLITATDTLGAGSYTATATKVSLLTARIESSGTHGRFTRRLIGVVEWDNKSGGSGSMSLYGGGNWRFSGNSHIEGNIASKGSIMFEGSSALCGQAHAEGDILPTGSDLLDHLQTGCASVVVPKSTVIQAYNDVWDYPYLPGVTNYSVTLEEAASPTGWTTLRVPGIVTFATNAQNPFVFGRDVTIVADKGFVITGPVSAAPGHWVKLYSMAAYGGSTPCQDVKGTAKAGDVGSELTVFVDQSEHHDVIFWAPNGMIFFTGSQGGGSTAGVYGKVYGKCVQTADNWNFYPGSDLPGGTCQLGCASSLRLKALYEPTN